MTIDSNGCRTCELVERRDRGEAPPWDCILRTPSWDVVHCYGTSVPGWLVLVCREHRTAIADLSDAEANELGSLLKQTSIALRDVLGSVKTYAVQFAEHPRHPHVHVHVIPRAADHPDELKGPRIFDQLGVPDEDAVPVARMNELASSITDHLERAGYRDEG
jgi:diadenosine tetraphosphate (Ap4A) HIT family hydrolase